MFNPLVYVKDLFSLKSYRLLNGKYHPGKFSRAARRQVRTITGYPDSEPGWPVPVKEATVPVPVPASFSNVSPVTAPVKRAPLASLDSPASNAIINSSLLVVEGWAY